MNKVLFLLVCIFVSLNSNASDKDVFYNARVPIWNQYKKLNCYMTESQTCRDNTCTKPSTQKIFFEIDFDKNKLQYKLVGDKIPDFEISHYYYHEKDSFYEETVNQFVIGGFAVVRLNFVKENQKNNNILTLEFTEIQLATLPYKKYSDIKSVAISNGQCSPN